MSKLTMCALLLSCLAVLTLAANATEKEMWQEPSHQLVFQNNGLRIMDVRVVPGVTSEYHWHRNATLYVTIAGAKIRTQAAGAEWIDRSNLPRATPGSIRDAAGQASRPLYHRIENADDRALHLVALVNERDLDAGVPAKPAVSGDRVDNAWFREHRLTLAAGAASPPLTFSHESVVVQFDAGKGHILENDVVHSVGTAPGAFSWHAPGSLYRVVNDAGTPREYVVIEIKSASGQP